MTRFARYGEPEESGQSLARQCKALRIRMSKKREALLQVIDDIEGHPHAEDIYARIQRIDASICMATVYRTLNILSEAKLLVRRTFSDGGVRYEKPKPPHAHIVDRQSGHIIEVQSDELSKKLREIAARAGFQLMDYTLELFAEPLESAENRSFLKALPRR